MLWPSPPATEIERITGKTHISLHNRREALKELEAWASGEDYQYTTPPTDEDGYLTEGHGE
jgi:hypothetical protein